MTNRDAQIHWTCMIIVYMKNSRPGTVHWNIICLILQRTVLACHKLLATHECESPSSNSSEVYQQQKLELELANNIPRPIVYKATHSTVQWLTQELQSFNRIVIIIA